VISFVADPRSRVVAPVRRGRRESGHDHRPHCRRQHLSAYTLVANVIERPDGIKIASFFIVAIVIVSLVSRALRSTELRANAVDFDEAAEHWIAEAIFQHAGPLPAPPDQ
jgi:hypothetical protein